MILPLSTVKHSAIKWLARFWRDPCTLLIVVLAGLGTAHILVRTATYGTPPNIATFRQVALNLLAGEGLRDFMGGPMVGFPPLFPLLLAAGGWVGIDPLVAGWWVNTTAFGLTILAAGGWLRSNLRSRWLVLATTATLAASLPLSEFASRLALGTDFLFAVLTLLALIQLAAFLHRRTAAPLWWAAVFTALAAITRYPGVVLIGVGTGVLLLLPLARLRQTLVFGAVSSVPLLAVLVHNWAVTGNLTQATGDRASWASGQSLSAGLHQTFEGVRAWVVPPNAPDGVVYLLGLAVAAVGLAGAVVLLRPRRMHRDAPEAPPVCVRLGPALPFGGFAVIYLAFLVVVVPFTVDQGIDSRYLLPAYVPLLLTAVFLLDRFLSIKAAGWMAAVRYGVTTLVGLATLAHIGFSARENLRYTTQVYVAWYGNTSEKLFRWQVPWQQSETLNYIRDSPIVGRVYSNKVTFALLADRTTAKLRTHRNIPHNIMGWDEIEAGAHIVWLDEFYYHNRPSRGYNYLDLRLLPGLEIVAELADGVVFRRTAYEPFDAARHHARKQRYIDQLIQQASEHVGRAGWDVYRTERTLLYRKQPCVPADVQAQFGLHIVPVDPADLPAHRQQYGLENLGFYFNFGSQRKSLGFRLGDQCIAIAQLPEYPINRIHTGQWIAAEDRTFWEAELEMHRAQKQRYIDQLIQQASEHVGRAGWDVYRTERTLLYRKQPCAPADVQAKFVLHVVPADPADLPAHRQQYDSDNLDFYFDWDAYFDYDYFDWDARRQSSSFRLGDQCIAIAQLPEYPIDRIYIGQWIAEEDRTLWEAEFSPGR